MGARRRSGIVVFVPVIWLVLFPASGARSAGTSPGPEGPPWAGPVPDATRRSHGQAGSSSAMPRGHATGWMTPRPRHRCSGCRTMVRAPPEARSAAAFPAKTEANAESTGSSGTVAPQTRHFSTLRVTARCVTTRRESSRLRYGHRPRSPLRALLRGGLLGIWPSPILIRRLHDLVAQSLELGLQGGPGLRRSWPRGPEARCARACWRESARRASDASRGRLGSGCSE